MKFVWYSIKIYAYHWGVILDSLQLIAWNRSNTGGIMYNYLKWQLKIYQRHLIVLNLRSSFERCFGSVRCALSGLLRAVWVWPYFESLGEKPAGFSMQLGRASWSPCVNLPWDGGSVFSLYGNKRRHSFATLLLKKARVRVHCDRNCESSG